MNCPLWTTCRRLAGNRLCGQPALVSMVGLLLLLAGPVLLMVLRWDPCRPPTGVPRRQC
jgi:hypothetical protein